MSTYFYTCTEGFAPSKLRRQGFGGIFFDRDGTIIAEKNYLKDINGLEFLPGVVPGLRRLKLTGLPIYLFTNQAGVAHGYFDEETVLRINQFLVKELMQTGISLRGVLCCPHHPHAEVETYRLDCFCRKPNPGLLYSAAEIDRLNLRESYVIGDKLTDLEAGKTVGAKTILVLTGYGASETRKISTELKPNFIGQNFTEVVNWIIRDYFKVKNCHRNLSI